MNQPQFLCIARSSTETEYQSRVTGNRYYISREGRAFFVRNQDDTLILRTRYKREALTLIELDDTRS